MTIAGSPRHGLTYFASDYIQIVVGDSGAGIPATLRGSFSGDPDARRYFPNDGAFNVIEYSFWKDSSSRRRDFEETIDEATPKELVPPTGLYFVKELVKRLRGLICVRAADTLWSADYTLGANRIVQIESWDVARFADLPGTVI